MVVDQQLSTFQAGISAAINSAEVSCKNKASNGSIIHVAFQKSMGAAQTTFKNERSGDNTIVGTIKQLIAQRNALFVSADKSFQSNQFLATQTLKRAFGKSSSI
jgi:hypothetical protein